MTTPPLHTHLLISYSDLSHDKKFIFLNCNCLKKFPLKELTREFDGKLFIQIMNQIIEFKISFLGLILQRKNINITIMGFSNTKHR